MTIRWFGFAAAMAFALCLGTHSAAAAPPLGAPVGTWLLSNQRIKLQIAPCDDRLCGTLVWFKNPIDARGLPLADLKNPDPSLRTRPLLGLTVLRGLRPTADGRWEDGHIYNPDDGKEYRARMSFAKDGSLHVRAYVVLEVLGKTQVMTRVKDQEVAASAQQPN